MVRLQRTGVAALVLALLAGLISIGAASAGKMTGVIVGRTGELLHISVSQPVREGTIFAIKPISTEPAIAEARVVSCTKEAPYIALAKVERGGIESPVPTGSYAYADAGAVSKEAPKPMAESSHRNGSRFSIQTGTFHPDSSSSQSKVSEFWQAYRLNYSLLAVGKFDALLSAEYARAIGDIVSGDQVTRRTTEIIPLTVLGRIHPIRTGGVNLYLGAGGGIYRIRTADRTDGQSISDTIDKFGREYAVGLESRHGWVVELRYRDIQNTDIRGYSLGIGAKF